MSARYSKQPLSSEELLDLLKGRKLAVADDTRALRYLDSIGYYRLSGYMYPFQMPDKSHRFVDGASFDAVVDLYKFDKKLRALVMEYMERIEVALRARLTNYYSIKHGFFWYANESLFARKDRWASLLKKIKEDFELPREQFLQAYKRNYAAEPLPPSQMILETLSLGDLTGLYEALRTDELKERIATEFRLVASFLETWLVWLTRVRNVCAHHGRLWNRNMSAKRPSMPSRRAFKFAVAMPEDANTNMYGVVALMHRLLKSFNPDNTFAAKVEALVREYGIDGTQMGFPVDWEQTAVWHHE